MKNVIFIMLTTIILSFLACKDKQASSKDVVENGGIEMNEEKTSIELQKKTILCFGNSLTAGYGLDEQYAWPRLLQEKLDSLKLDFNVVNAGLSGETAAGGLNRIDWVLSQEVDIFILELGANDMLRGFDLESTRANLKAILDKVKEKYPDAEMVIAGMLSPPNMGPEYEKGFNAMFPALAKEYNAKLIPFFLKDVAGVKSLNLQDGKHPNKEGQKIVLNNVWQVISNMI